MVNLEWYRSFVAVYQSGTLTAASEKRFLTQPALSQHIAALEHALAVALFERRSRRMFPTEAARQLYPRIIASIEKLEAISAQNLKQGFKTSLRIGCPITYFNEKLITQLNKKVFDNYRLRVSLGETKELVSQLQHNALDIVIATQQISAARVRYQRLFEEEFLLVLPKSLNFPFTKSAKAGDIALWLSEQNWIAYSVELPIIRRYWQTAFKIRPEFEPRLIIPDLHAILRCVENGMGISVLPNYLVRETSNDNIKIVWRPPKKVSNVLYFAYAQEREFDPLLEFARKALAKR